MTNHSIENTFPFKVGDIVHLVSGSPRLTVIQVNDDQITCAWFSWPDNHAHTAEFPILALIRHVDRIFQSALPDNRYPWDEEKPEQKKPSIYRFGGPGPFSDPHPFGDANPSKEGPL